MSEKSEGLRLCEALREALIAKRSWEAGVRGVWWPANGPVQVPTGKHPPLYPLSSDVQEAKLRQMPHWLGTEAPGCVDAARRSRLGGVARVGDSQKAWSAFCELRKAQGSNDFTE